MGGEFGTRRWDIPLRFEASAELREGTAPCVSVHLGQDPSSRSRKLKQ